MYLKGTTRQRIQHAAAAVATAMQAADLAVWAASTSGWIPPHDEIRIALTAAHLGLSVTVGIIRRPTE